MNYWRVMVHVLGILLIWTLWWLGYPPATMAFWAGIVLVITAIVPVGYGAERDGTVSDEQE